MNDDEAKIRELEEKLRIARRALGTAARVFRTYQDIHRAKGTMEASHKARENGALADKMELALQETL